MLRLSSDRTYIALREYIAAGESLFATRQRIAAEGSNTRCPAPGTRNESIPLCTDIIASYDAQVKSNWDAAQDSIMQLNNNIRTLLQQDNRFVNEITNIQNDRSMRYWMLAAFLMIVILASLLITFAAIFRPHFLPKDLTVNARSLAAFALIILPLFFGFLIEKVPESLIVAVVSGASGWLFGSATKEPKIP